MQILHKYTWTPLIFFKYPSRLLFQFFSVFLRHEGLLSLSTDSTQLIPFYSEKPRRILSTSCWIRTAASRNVYLNSTHALTDSATTAGQRYHCFIYLLAYNLISAKIMTLQVTVPQHRVTNMTLQVTTDIKSYDRVTTELRQSY